MENPINPFVKVDDERLKLEQDIAELEIIEREIRDRLLYKEPGYYDLPDLTFPKNFNPGKFNRETIEWDRKRRRGVESDASYVERQNKAVKDMIENHFKFDNDGQWVEVHLIDKQIKLIADFFYMRVNRAILWKSRGCGGSLCAAIIIWLMIVYHNVSFIDLGGSLEQSKVIYQYTVKFWDMVPGMSTHFVIGKPLMTHTKTIGGAVLKCITATDRAARGKHQPGLILDEACQDNDKTGDVFNAAIGTVLDSTPHFVLALSTFHNPTGFFADLWDNASEKGFVRYNWDCFDCQQKCATGLEFATKEDPYAIDTFCKEKCMLTERHDVFDKQGNKIGIEYTGCAGKARFTDGFRSRQTNVDSKIMYRGTERFEVEFCNMRPQFSGPIYGLKAIEGSIVESIEIENPEEFYEQSNSNRRAIVGIDWGISIEGAINLMLPCEDYLVVIEALSFSNRLLREWKDKIDEWENIWGPTRIYADSSHPFNNDELAEDGYDITPVEFKSIKDYGIDNLSKLFINNRIKILADNDQMISQLKKYHRNPETGKIVKKNDHHCDSLLAATVTFDCYEIWPVNPVIEDLKKQNNYGLRAEKSQNAEKIVDNDLNILLY